MADMIYLSLIAAHWAQGVTTAIMKLKFVAFYLNSSKPIQLINPLWSKLYFCSSTIKIAFVSVLPHPTSPPASVVLVGVLVLFPHKQSQNIGSLPRALQQKLKSAHLANKSVHLQLQCNWIHILFLRVLRWCSPRLCLNPTV